VSRPTKSSTKVQPPKKVTAPPVSNDVFTVGTQVEVIDDSAEDSEPEPEEVPLPTNNAEWPTPLQSQLSLVCLSSFN
jgi:hypothetical protein